MSKRGNHENLKGLIIFMIASGPAFSYASYVGGKGLIFTAVGLCMTMVGILILIMMSEGFHRWMFHGKDEEKIKEEMDRAAYFLQKENYHEALITFQKVIDIAEPHYAFPGVYLGMAYSLEKLGNLNMAIDQYGYAYSLRFGKYNLAARADFYVRALMRRKNEGDIEAALGVCNNALDRLKGVSNPEVDELKIGRGIILWELGRYEEAQKEFIMVGKMAQKEETRDTARLWASFTSLSNVAKKGQEHFFKHLEVFNEALRRYN